jgi:hypothetical protein
MPSFPLGQQRDFLPFILWPRRGRCQHKSRQEQCCVNDPQVFAARHRRLPVLAAVGHYLGPRCKVSMVTSEQPRHVPFEAHIELLRAFLAQRDQIVERIQGVLNAQQKPVQYLQDRALLSRQFEDCFFAAPVAREQFALRGQLQAAHWASGFRPRDMPGIPNEMFDPADMMARAFNLWRNTRWTGRNGRVRYAQTLFNLYVVRNLALLDMRLWDDGVAAAGKRLVQLQDVLAALWKSSPADQPVLVRDVRWLVPVAQSPTTDELAPYFEVAQKVAESLPEEDRIEILKAGILMAGGHLRSQLRHFNMQGRQLTEPALILSTRGSNALDCAMTIQGLVPLLKGYEQAIQQGDQGRRVELAGAICQGVSSDPELFVNRVDLLGVYSMIEHLFITVDAAGIAMYTTMGQRHVQLLQEYTTLIDRAAPALCEDCPQFRPLPGAYSPYGVMYGFSSNILEHMTLKASQPEAETRFTLEDVFTDAGRGAERLAWVSGWRQLPHMPQEVQKLYQYPQSFAEEIFGRIEQALQKRVAQGGAGDAWRTGRLFIVPAGGVEDVQTAAVPELPLEYVLSSDPEVVAAHKAQPCDQQRLLDDRNEGMHLLSYQTPGGWVAIRKDFLTELLGAGRDVKIEDLPVVAAGVLRLMCPTLSA